VPAPEPADFSFHAAACSAGNTAGHRPVSGVQRTVLAAVTGQDAFGCVLAGIPGA